MALRGGGDVVRCRCWGTVYPDRARPGAPGDAPVGGVSLRLARRTRKGFAGVGKEVRPWRRRPAEPSALGRRPPPATPTPRPPRPTRDCLAYRLRYARQRPRWRGVSPVGAANTGGALPGLG